ncbi:MAG: hypothetical protein AB7O43_07050 [Hyphomicrobiaceae bacterium]
MTGIDRRELLFGSVSALAGALPATAFAEGTSKLGAAAFYKRSPLRVLIGAPAGSRYEALGRLIAPHLARRLSTQVSIETAHGGATGALRQLGDMPADGTVMAMVSAEATLIRQLLGTRGNEVDASSLNWLAGLSGSPKLWLASRSSSLRSVQDAVRARQLRWPAAGPADTFSDVAAILSYALGLKSKIVTGFSGPSDMARAVIDRNADCCLLPADTALRSAQFAELHPLAVLAPHRVQDHPNVPPITEVYQLPSDRKWMLDLRMEIGAIQQALVMTHGVPAYRVGYLRKALSDVLANETVLNEAKAARLTLSHSGGAALQTRISAALKQAVPRSAEFRKVALGTYL